MPLDPTRRDHYPARARAALAEVGARAPRPVRVGNVRVGTCSWTDPTLVRSGLFYPKGASTAEGRLRYYASQFSVVEVDASFYALPSADAARGWAARTPDDFALDLKAFASITGHDVELARLPLALRELAPAGARGKLRTDALPDELRAACLFWFVDALAPLRAAGKLGCVLCQLPPWVDATRGNARRIEALREAMPDLPLAVELRHASWLEASRRARLADLLRAHRLTLVAVDTPQGAATALPPWAEVTEESLAVVRFHGRNRAAWGARAGTAAERFDHLYAPEELAEWVEPVRRLAGEARQVHALFNNCTYDAAQLSGYALGALLQDAAG